MCDTMPSCQGDHTPRVAKGTRYSLGQCLLLSCCHSSIPTDIASLASKHPEGDNEVPLVNSWQDFLKALKDGKIYINVHSVSQPAGLIRGNLYAAEAGSMTATSGGNTGPAASGRRLFHLLFGRTLRQTTGKLVQPPRDLQGGQH